MSEYTTILEKLDAIHADIKAGQSVLVEDSTIDVPPAPPPAQIPAQFSPPEVANAPDDQWETQQGLTCSVKRSYGCVRIKPHYEGGVRWRDKSGEVAAEMGLSARIVKMLGFQWLRHQWHGLPTSEYLGAGAAAKPYTPWKPEVPFNDEENALWQHMWQKYHMRGIVAKGGWTNHILEFTNGARAPQHYVWMALGKPQDVIPKLAGIFVKDGGESWIREQYWKMCLEAHRMDAGERPKLTGYDDPGQRSEAWYNANGEDTSRSSGGFLDSTKFHF